MKKRGESRVFFLRCAHPAWVPPCEPALERRLGEGARTRRNRLTVIACTQKCVVVPLDATIALFASDLHREHRLALQGRQGIQYYVNNSY